ncbi:MAG TPA: DUF1206 domain-containing protein [Longimicrobiaceae bacterium]|nr:DUF1206 domain-containing protein [Longimicrobiaceae bacterium]
MANIEVERAIFGRSRTAAGEAAPWIERLARFGYAAKGVVYAVVGGIAFDAAIGAGRATGSRGALESMLGQPLGRVMLGLVAVGLAGYVVWKAVQAIMDPEHLGTDAKGWFKRAAFALTAVIYAGLALAAARLALSGSSGGGGAGAEGDGSGPDRWVTMVMDKPLGRWAIAAVGVGIIAYGIYNLYKGYAAKLSEELDLSDLEPENRRRVIWTGRFGMAARGVVFGIVGWFLIMAALHYEPTEAMGLGGALRTLENQPYGPWLLGAVALGLVAYGLFYLVKARYRRIDAHT